MVYLIGALITFALTCIMLAKYIAENPDWDWEEHPELMTLILVPFAWPIVLMLIIFGVIPYYYFKDPEGFKKKFKHGI